MDRLIPQELIEQLVVKEVTHLGRMYRPIFGYTGKTVVDTHEVEVGFVRDDGTVESGYVYLPSKRADGLIQRFKTLWYPVNLVVPPVCFLESPTCKSYLSSLINEDRTATKLTDFLPQALSGKPAVMTPLMESLYNRDGDPIEDTSKWIVLDTATALIELFNLKIVGDIERSTRGGFNGISAGVRSLNTLMRAYVRFHGEEDDDSEFGAYLETDGDNVHDEYESIVLGKVSIEDRKGVLVIHNAIKKVGIRPDTPIDFCTCSQSRPMVTGRIKDGVTVQNCRFTGSPTFPYTRWRRGVVGITSDDPRRVLVGRAISRALCIENPMKPYAESDVILTIDSLSLPGVRMTHPMNYEDGLVVSQTFADSMSAYKIYTDTFAVPAGTEVFVAKTEFDGMVDRREAARAARSMQREEFDASYVVRPGDVVATQVYKDLEEQVVVKEVKTRMKVPAIVLRIEHIETPTDMQEDGKMVRIVLYAHLPLSVGDKVSDGHGNKSTVSVILPDSQMPMWEGIRCHYIATPYLMKRLSLGGEVEDRLALIGYYMEQQVQWNSADPPTFEEVHQYFQEIAEDEPKCAAMKYEGTVTMEDGKTYDGVPVSMRRMYRLDNVAAEALIVRTGVRMEDDKRVGRNIKLSLEIATFLANGARNIAHEVIEQSGARQYIATHLMPLMHTMTCQVPQEYVDADKVITIKKRLPRTLNSGPVSMKELRKHDLTDTPADPRLKECYGVIKYKGLTVVIPPHDPITDLSNGSVTISKFSTGANRVISEIQSEQIVNRCETILHVKQPYVKERIKDYYESVAKSLAGKGGIIRHAILPVFPCTIRAVVTPHGVRDPFMIMLPRRGFKYMLKHNEKAAQVYEDKRNWQCLVKRDPVHRVNNVLTVRFSLWDRDTIGVSPLLIGALDGDYDGDAVVAMFPLTPSARAELCMMQPRFEDIYQPSKQLKDVPAHEAMDALMNNVGWASTVDRPHASDVLKNEKLFDLLRNRETFEESFPELSAEAINAARDFELVKDGTAFCGALGLRFTYSITADRADLLKEAMQLYHVLAQNTLDAKAGALTPAIAVVDHFTQGRASKLREDLAVLGYTHEPCIERLVELCKEIKAYPSTKNSSKFMKYLRERHPVTACIQRSSGKYEVVALARAILGDQSVGGGMWETLVDYLTGKSDESVFAYSQNWSFVEHQSKMQDTLLAKKIGEVLG